MVDLHQNIIMLLLFLMKLIHGLMVHQILKHVIGMNFSPWTLHSSPITGSLTFPWTADELFSYQRFLNVPKNRVDLLAFGLFVHSACCLIEVDDLQTALEIVNASFSFYASQTLITTPLTTSTSIMLEDE